MGEAQREAASNITWTLCWILISECFQYQAGIQSKQMMDGATNWLSLSPLSSLSLLQPDTSKWFIFGLFPFDWLSFNFPFRHRIHYFLTNYRVWRLYCTIFVSRLLLLTHLLSSSVILLLSFCIGCPLAMRLCSGRNINGHSKGTSLVLRGCIFLSQRFRLVLLLSLNM